MIQYSKIRDTAVKGLSQYLAVPVIRRNQAAPAPKYPFLSYAVLTLASSNNGTWQKHEDGKDRKLVRHSWSITAQSDDNAESVELAMKARDWLDRVGRTWLKDNGVTVQSVTEITNRDNILSVGYEYKNGFDVFFYAFDEVDNPDADNIIENATIKGGMN